MPFAKVFIIFVINRKKGDRYKPIPFLLVLKYSHYLFFNSKLIQLQNAEFFQHSRHHDMMVE